MPFAILHMPCQPPGSGLNIGVPRVFGFVGVAIVAGAFQDRSHFYRHVVFGGYVVLLIVGVIFFRAEELDDDHNGQETEEDFLDHVFLFSKKIKNNKGWKTL
jgi:hypothetical protein